MKTGYKITILAVSGFFAIWLLTPTIVMHSCNALEVDWTTSWFCNIKGELVIQAFVWDPNLSSNPGIQLIDQMTQPKFCTYNKNDKSLPSCEEYDFGFQ